MPPSPRSSSGHTLWVSRRQIHQTLHNTQLSPAAASGSVEAMEPTLGTLAVLPTNCTTGFAAVVSAA